MIVNSKYSICRKHLSTFSAATICYQAVSPFAFAFDCLPWQETASVCEQK